MSKLCPFCSVELREPYIRCVGCNPPINICPKCFASGREIGEHVNNHKYVVRQNNFPLFAEDWNVNEELSLLDHLLEFGYGNWTNVAKQMQTKSSNECMQHYNEYYVTNPSHGLPDLNQDVDSCSMAHGSSSLPLRQSEDPPRPLPDSDQALELAGYMPGRGDFSIEYDDFAETMVKDIELDEADDELMIELKLAAFDIYHSRLRRRHYRKRIIKDYGLINVRKDASVAYSKKEWMIKESLKVFTRLQTAEKSEMFLQGILLQANLKRQIKDLQEWRKAGLKSKRDGVIYKRLLKKRNEMRSRGNIMNEVLCHIEFPVSCQIWLQKQLQANLTVKTVPGINMFPLLSRKPAAPLDLSGTPGLEQLSEEEKEICSNLRFLPLQYLGHKNILMKESQRLGSLKLQQARTLVKIDVNKTKKLYEFFIEKGWVCKGND